MNSWHTHNILIMHSFYMFHEEIEGLGVGQERKNKLQKNKIHSSNAIYEKLCSLKSSLMETVSADVEQRDLETAINTTLVAAGLANKV